ncbi:MAG: hypothetical protein HS111_32170 [Kofleriaceae bacterium]|nr:hypothetical protein [Kofleriaceae bacterium]
MRIDAGARDQCYGARRMSDHEGKVSIRGKDTDKVTIVVTDAGGKEHLYPLEPRALIAPGIEDGTKKHVKPGELLADEKNRRYRLVKIEFDDGRPIDMREEVRNVNGQWVQRGSESTRRGRIAEHAARLQADANLAKVKSQSLCECLTGNLADWWWCARS